MQLKNLRIGVQLTLGLGVILVLVVFLGANSWIQSDLLWQQTQGLYDHPLQVRRAIGELRADVLTLRLGMQSLFLIEGEEEIQPILQRNDTAQVNAYRQFNVLYDRYLGPVSDIDDAYQAFVQWESVRDETIRLLRAGQMAEARRRVQPGGAGDVQADAVLRHIQDVSDFATARADRFFQDATALNKSLNLELAIAIALILLLSTLVSYFLQRGIREPLLELTAVTERFGRGQHDARSQYVSNNEFGTLAASFNAMAATIQADNERRASVARIADVMLRQQEMHEFCRALLRELVEQTGSQMGAIYLLNAQKTAFEPYEALGLSVAARAPLSATAYEGEFGAALATRQIQTISDIPTDTQFTFAAVSGDFRPRAIITVPVVADSDVAAMISLASLRDYPAPVVQAVKDVWPVLTARLNGVLASQRVRVQAGQLQDQNRELVAQANELAAQANELTQQANELTQQNVELEAQKRQLDEVSRFKSSFLSNMSHELRTPLNSVIALSGVLGRRLRDVVPAEEYGYLEVIERNGQTLLALINDILDLSRIESGREEINIDHFSVRSLVGDVVSMLAPLAEAKGIALLSRIGDDLPPLRSDAAKCRHILQNIVSNAVKFTDTGSVEVTATRVDEAIDIAVADTGIGIAAEIIPCIFDEFRQADESASRKYGGTGLGLAIAHRYAAMLGGSIGVVSTPGRGSTFTLRLPLQLNLTAAAYMSADHAGPGGPVTAAGQSPAGQGKSILVVEDSEPAVIQLTDILSEHGYQVRVARSGQEALAQVASDPPDGVVLDLMMPEVDGFEVLRQLRSAERTAHLPVLILTAKHVTREELSSLEGNNIRQVIQKGGIDKPELLAAIARMVAPQPARPSRAMLPGRSRSRGRPLVLVIDDNSDSRQTIIALLGDSFAIIEAADGAMAVDLVRTHRPDLILMDISLPGADGYQTLTAIRSGEAGKNVPVIAVTARAMKGDREEILARGFNGYVSKPIDEARLTAAIREALDEDADA